MKASRGAPAERLPDSADPPDCRHAALQWDKPAKDWVRQPGMGESATREAVQAEEKSCGQ